MLTPTWDAARGMTSSSQTKTVAVALNVESVHWTVTSDSEWCVVDEETTHVGSGEFTVEVTANEDFKSRDAVVTLSAGAFTCRMTVDQSGNIFILDKVYSVVAPNDAEAIEVVVKTLSKWQPVDSEWIHGEVVETSEPDAEGMTTSTLRIRCDVNTDAAGRYGTLTLEPTDGVGYSTEYAVYQFGADMPFDTDGKLDLAAKGEVKFDVVAPAEAVVGVTCPTWVTYVSEPDGERATYTFSVAENPSDTKTEREGVIEFSIKDIEAQTALPAIRQAFYPAGGIVSGAGLKMFAEAFNAGGDISDWTSGEDGRTVEVLGDVDMKDVAWTAVGTAERPFDGVVAGNGHLILNWNTAQPLFGHMAEGSEIRDLTIDASSKLTAKSVAKDVYAAAFAGVCNGTLKNCRNMAAVTLDVAATVDGACGVAGVAGLVGAAGHVENCANTAFVTLSGNVVGSKISVGGVVAETEAGAVVTGCTNEGGISSSGATPKVNTAGIYTGGVVGWAGGAVENCTTEGGKTIALQITAGYMSYTGGIVGWADGSVTGCTNKQPLSISANRLGDACRYAYAGGVAGKSVGALTGSKNRGNLTATAICKFVIMGGIVGSADGVVSDVVNVAAVSVPGNPDGVNGALKEKYFGPRYAYVGGIAGQLRIDGTLTGNGDTTNSGAVTIEQMEYSTEDIVAVGGVVGQQLGKVSNTVNSGAVTVSASPAAGGTIAWKVRCAGGISGLLGEIGKTYAEASVAGSKNLALVKQERTTVRSNGMPAYVGGIVGYIYESAASVSGCTNSGEVNNDYYNNNIDFDAAESAKRTNCTGGIVGAASTLGEPNVISSCSNSGLIPIYRGIGGGVVAYADGVGIRDCTNTSSFPTSNRNGVTGGIAGQVLNAQIEGCLNKALVFADGTGDAVTVKAGGIVGDLGENSAVRGSKHYGVVYPKIYGSTAKPEYKVLTSGGIAGVSVKGAVIENCGFGGQLKGADDAHTFEMKLENICSDTNFTGSGNSLWDGK
ncbi:MAG: BACON domain-containing protein [Alistipes shahii]